MGMEIPNLPEEEAEEAGQQQRQENNEGISLQSLPTVFFVGPANVGKRSILQRLLGMGQRKGLPCTTSGVTCHGWTIDTKYYTADVCISMARLSDTATYESARSYALSINCQALVLVFDLSNFSTFETLQEWVSSLELHDFEILLCIGNKADCVPDHFGHREYRQRLQKRGESSSDPHPEFWDYGIQCSDGSSLLNDEGSSTDMRRQSCIAWCADHGIEYIEACAVDTLFDQCMSVDGDLQGVTRIWGALSAHMWPGMTMKSDKQSSSALASDEVEDNSTDEDSEITIQYELLSNGSAEPWDGDDGPWSFYEDAGISSALSNNDQEAGSSSDAPAMQSDTLSASLQQNLSGVDEPAGSSGDVPPMQSDTLTESLQQDLPGVDEPADTSSSTSHEMTSNTGSEQTISSSLNNMILTPHAGNGNGPPEAVRGDIGSHPASQSPSGNGTSQQEHRSNDLERLMMEMARMRENAHLMPDTQRRERAAMLALQMASMFDDDDDD